MKDYLTRETFPKSHRVKRILLTREGKPRILAVSTSSGKHTSTREKKGEKGRHSKDGYRNKRAKGSLKRTKKRRKH